MGSVKDQEPSELTTGAAINQVLQAERGALEAIEESRLKAEAILLAARHEVAEIAARADKRIGRIRKKRSKLNKKHIKQSLSNQEQTAPLKSGEAEARLLLENIAQQLAAQLTKGEPLAAKDRTE